MGCPAKPDRRFAGLCFSHGVDNPVVRGGHVQEACWLIAGPALHIYFDYPFDGYNFVEFPREISILFAHYYYGIFNYNLSNATLRSCFTFRLGLERFLAVKMTNPSPPGYLDDEKKGRITVTTTEVEDFPPPKTESVVSMGAFVTAASASEGGTLVPDESDKPSNELSTWQTSIIIITLSGITLTTSMSVGAFTIALPAMAKDMNLTAQFLLW